SSIRQSSSDSEASESSIEIQIIPAPRGLITKEPFKGPAGHSSQKSKRQECLPKGEAQMEDARASTSSQRLASTIDTFIESPEADITAIPVFRPESFSTGSNRDIPFSVQELVYGVKEAGVGTSAKSLDSENELLSSSEEVCGPRKDRRTSEGLAPMSFKGQVQQIKAWLKTQSMLSEDQKKKMAQGKDNSPVEAPQASSKSAKQGQENPKEQSEGQAKGKGKVITQVEQALPTELQNSQEREDSHGQCA
ncbi:hypothetical protein O181_033762, partial [Austropuccinia psidii MF-1]|nr:hypothetical protein [Austropuccinia psidii MF-1]